MAMSVPNCDLWAFLALANRLYSSGLAHGLSGSGPWDQICLPCAGLPAFIVLHRDHVITYLSERERDLLDLE